MPTVRANIRPASLDHVLDGYKRPQDDTEYKGEKIRHDDMFTNGQVDARRSSPVSDRIRYRDESWLCLQGHILETARQSENGIIRRRSLCGVDLSCTLTDEPMCNFNRTKPRGCEKDKQVAEIQSSNAVARIMSEQNGGSQSSSPKADDTQLGEWRRYGPPRSDTM